MTFQISEAIAANANGDGSLSIYQDQKIIYLNPVESKKFKVWLNEVV